MGIHFMKNRVFYAMSSDKTKYSSVISETSSGRVVIRMASVIAAICLLVGGVVLIIGLLQSRINVLFIILGLLIMISAVSVFPLVAIGEIAIDIRLIRNSLDGSANKEELSSLSQTTQNQFVSDDEVSLNIMRIREILESSEKGALLTETRLIREFLESKDERHKEMIKKMVNEKLNKS